MAPGYIARVWNLQELSGVMLGTFPIEELLFGFGIGTYWSGVYEHLHGIAVDDGELTRFNIELKESHDARSSQRPGLPHGGHGGVLPNQI